MDSTRSPEELSRFLSFLLRHHPEAVGVRLAVDGWVRIDDLLAGIAAHGAPLGRDALMEAVRTNANRRFAVSPDGLRIRASQGHSARSGVRLSGSLPPRAPPAILFHGTKGRLLAPIRRKGLLRMSREHVHLSASPEAAAAVGDRREGRTVVLTVDAAAMARCGMLFRRSDNGVWLVGHVPPRYIRFRE